MKRLILLSLAAFAVTGPAFAATACSTAPEAQWQPQAKLEAMLKTQNLTPVQIKVENGCYEVYAKDASGKRVNAAYNAETLAQVDNAEAGEN